MAPDRPPLAQGPTEHTPAKPPAVVSPDLAARWFRALYETPNLFSGLLDDAGVVLDANRASVEGCGLVRGLMVGRPFWDGGWWAASVERRAEVQAWCRQVLRDGETLLIVSPYVLGDGTARVLDLALAPVKDDHGRVTHLVATGSDITEFAATQRDRELHAAEARLARAQELAGKVLDSVADGIYGLDAEGRVEFVNPAAAKITGYSQAEQIGGDQHTLLHGRRADGSAYPRVECPVWLAVQTGLTVTGHDEVFWRSDGTAVPVDLVAVPTVEDGAVTGVVVSFRDTTSQRETRRQAELLREVTEREASQRALADRLQQALLTSPPEPDHLHLVVRYRAAAHEAQVGGDWYDAFLQPDGASMLVIGDVVGHDGTAAAKMGQLRGLLRALAYSTDDAPAAVLTRVEHAARGLAVDTLATAVLARIERSPDVPVCGSRTLRWSNAGHLPPVLLHQDGTSNVLGSEPDLLLGVDPDATRHDHTTELPDSATLLLFTDGLVERRGASLDDGLARLQAALADLAEVPLDELCDTLLGRMVPEPGEDDIALLAVRTYPEDRPRPATAGPNRLPPDQR